MKPFVIAFALFSLIQLFVNFQLYMRTKRDDQAERRMSTETKVEPTKK